MKRPFASLSGHSWLSPRSIVSSHVGIVVAGDWGAAAGVSRPGAEQLGPSARQSFLPDTGTGTSRRGLSHGGSGSTTVVPVPVRGKVQETYDVIFARGVAAPGTDGVRAATSIGPLGWAAVVASMLLRVSLPVRACCVLRVDSVIVFTGCDTLDFDMYSGVRLKGVWSLTHLRWSSDGREQIQRIYPLVCFHRVVIRGGCASIRVVQ